MPFPQHHIPRWCLPIGAVLALAACGGSDNDDNGGTPPDPTTYSAEIRRTEMSIPHIKASNWAGLGYGAGYAQASDDLCTLADGFLTFRGERSKYFGADALAAYSSTIGRPRNLDSDLFFKHVANDEAVKAMMAAQTNDALEAMEGFAAGYNRYITEAKSSQANANSACRSAEWVQPITALDMWRRVMGANLAGGYSNFVAMIANAQPPAASATQSSAKSAAQATPMEIAPGSMKTPDLQVGGNAGIGSNMYGFGPQATGSSAVLFGNPHWYWKGVDRFYQMQLTIDGQVNVSGASFLGFPIPQIGFNNDVAWSHTVSTARRFGFFGMTLDPNDPTRYVLDGQAKPFIARDIEVSVKGVDGGQTTVKRTLYATEQGPVINLSALHPALGWNAQSAVVIRDVNALNYRTVRNWMRWSQAGSLDEFANIQREESAIPWVNTIAAGRGSEQVWYADIGAVPNAPESLLASCGTPFSAAAAVALPGVPVLDGSRSACNWQSDADSVQAGAIGPARMPSLRRSDYVGNMNDSYWLTNANAPLTGFPSIFGPAGTQAQTLRTRLGHRMALERLAGTDSYGSNLATSSIVRQMVLDSRIESTRFKDEILDLVCEGDDAASRANACAVLAAWDNRGTASSRGSHLWDEFWMNLGSVASSTLYLTPFDAQDPLNTPRDINPATRAQLAQAFDTAVATVQASGFALDAPRGEVLYLTRSGERLPLYGGCGGVGYFTINCSELRLTSTGFSMDGQPHGNSYMQVVSFPSSGVEAYSFLTFSLSDDPASPHYGDYSQAYSQQQWVRLPFSEAEIAQAPSLRTSSISE
ncbi:penicillin acylase family protein [Lampropedia puyangensis]|uniref:Penicillin acylase family protein n=1 Tax=Lampropedia puyangensis TaxID=1330072 RepID=A0A4S8EX14_9BURK|nr:penicillin acylase family protein [Lampropedia puyangensis]THT99352.1 penicillin acylase family protein [Lampropedia puyangensis]